MLYGKLLKYPIYNSSVRGQIFLCFTSLGVFLCIRVFCHFTPAKKLASKEKGFGVLGPFGILTNLPPFWGTGTACPLRSPTRDGCGYLYNRAQ